MKITSVTIEGMHNVVNKTYTFNNVNYLHGKNGAGKSTVLQAVQLALFGYIPGQPKTKESILTNSNNHTMAVTLELTGDSQPVTIRRVWTKTSKGSNSVVDITPDSFTLESILSELELPVFNFNEFRRLTANKLKDWFIDFLPSGKAKFDWDKLLRDKVKGSTAYDDIIKEACEEFESLKSAKPVDIVRYANSYFKDKISVCKTEINRLDATVKSLIFYDDIDTTTLSADLVGEELDKYRNLRTSIINDNAKIAIRQNAISELESIQASAGTQTVEEIDKQIEELKNKISELQAAIEDKFSAMSNMSTQARELMNKCAEIKSSYSGKEQVISSNGICSYTNTQCPSIVEMIEQLKAEVAEAKAEYNEIYKQSEIASKNVTEINSYISNINDSIREKSILLSSLESDKAILQKNKERIAQLTAVIADTEGLSEVKDTSELDTKIKELEGTLVKILANEKFEKMSETLASEKMKFELNMIAYKAWENLTGVNGLQNKVSTEPFVNFGAAMDKYIKPLFGNDVSAAFNLVEKANSFSFGISRDGQYIPYDLLSSGEKCMFTLAMMITLVANSKDELKLIMIDDMFDNLDDENANSLMNKLSEINDVQFIVAGVKDIKVSKEVVIEVTAEWMTTSQF